MPIWLASRSTDETAPPEPIISGTLGRFREVPRLAVPRSGTPGGPGGRGGGGGGARARAETAPRPRTTRRRRRLIGRPYPWAAGVRALRSSGFVQLSVSIGQHRSAPGSLDDNEGLGADRLRAPCRPSAGAVRR